VRLLLYFSTVETMEAKGPEHDRYTIALPRIADVIGDTGAVAY
jgi:hypothetical protein